MKNYGRITDAYLATNGLIRCRIVNQLGEPVLHLLTEAQIKAHRNRGVNVRTPSRDS